MLWEVEKEEEEGKKVNQKQKQKYLAQANLYEYDIISCLNAFVNYL